MQINLVIVEISVWQLGDKLAGIVVEIAFAASKFMWLTDAKRHRPISSIKESPVRALFLTSA